MKICNQCGVELEDGIDSCPLCAAPFATDQPSRSVVREMKPGNMEGGNKAHLMRRVLWQITAVLLVSGVVATLTINLAVAEKVTWAIYPITICLIIFAYASLIALWRTKFIVHLLGGWFISSLLLILINQIFAAQWIMLLAWPILSSINVAAIFLYFMIRSLKTRGLNIFALVIVSLAGLSLIIESFISLYVTGFIHLGWSVIVTACLLPVTAAILFMYYRTRSNSELQKIFHT